MEEQVEVYKLTIHLSTTEDTLSLYVSADTKARLIERLERVGSNVSNCFVGQDIDGDDFFLDLDCVTFLGCATGRITKHTLDDNDYTVHRHIEMNKQKTKSPSDIMFERILEKAMNISKQNNEDEDEDKDEDED